MATDYTSTVYGLGKSRMGGDKTTTNTDLSPILRNSPNIANKGQKCVRYIIAAGTAGQIMGGEIWVNADLALIATDTFTLTVTADG